MKNLKIKETKSTPSIITISSKGVIQVKGISIPENSLAFYDNAKKWIDEYLNQNKAITFIFKLHYLNSSSVHVISDLLKYTKEKSKNINVIWYYELDDEDIMDAGEHISSSSDIDFEMRGMREVFKGFNF